MVERKYRPANGTEGEGFMEVYCYNCVFEGDDSPCPILSATMYRNVDDPYYPNQWVEDEQGNSRCVEFARKKRR